MTETSNDRVIGQKPFRKLVESFGHRKSKIQSLSGELGETIRIAVDNQNLHRGAFALIARLDKMDEMKRNDFLRSFALYRDYMESDGGTWSATPDMVDQAEAPATGPTDDEKVETNVRALRRGIKPLGEKVVGMPGAPDPAGDDAGAAAPAVAH